METLSEIVAQMRGRGEDGRMDRRLWLDYADRIDAARKREREAVTNSNQPGNAAACTGMTIDDAISHAEEVANASDTPCARQHRKLADWLRELKRLRKSNDKRCNAAAMREALEMIAKVSVPPIRIHLSSPGNGVIIHEPEPESEWLALLRKCVKRANAALAAPPRQCDVGTAEDQGTRCLAQIRAWRFGGPRLIDSIMKWTQMPYEEERKGDGDGE